MNHDASIQTNLRSSLHELNNVFTIIVSSADLMLLDTNPGSQTEEDIKNILSACERGKKIIESVRAGMSKD